MSPTVRVVSNINHSVYLARALAELGVIGSYSSPVIWPHLSQRVLRAAPLLRTRVYPEAAGLPIHRQYLLELAGRVSSRLRGNPGAMALARRQSVTYDHLATRQLRRDAEASRAIHWHTAGLVHFAEAARRHADLLIADHRDIHPAAHDYEDPLGERLAVEFAAADFIVLNSEVAAATFHDRGFAPNRLVVVPLGATADRSLPDTAPIDLLFVGALSRRKGIDLLAEAITTLPARLTVVGAIEDEGLANYLLSLPSVDYRGVQPRAVVHQLMRSASALVLPSRLDSYGLVAAESVVNGTPVIVSDACGIAGDILRSRTGFVVPAGEAAGLAQAMSQLHDGNARAVLAQQCVAAAGQFSWQGYEDRIARFYRDQVLVTTSA